MRENIKNLIASYVDALRPIIYINHFDFKAADDIIESIATNVKIYEYNNANGDVDFKTKACLNKCTLIGFLDYIIDEAFEHNIFIILKDIHKYLENPEIVAKLKYISEKNIYKDNFYATIFIISPNLVIPAELEDYITIIDIPAPTINQIKEIINEFASDLNININEDLIDEFSLELKGLNEFQIIQILNLAYQKGGYIDRNDKQLIIKEKEQIIKKSGMVEIVNFNESIDEIGGLEVLKQWLITKSNIFKKLDKAIKFGIDIPKGIMIIGMPGCGKSLTAKATARLFEVPLLRLDVGRLLGKYVGESENNLRKALKIAETISPCILWIDEIEKAFAGIGSQGGASDITTRLFGQFLTWLQEKDSSVFVVATANDISTLPPEFLRKGRFDELFFVNLPNPEERRQIFEIHLKKRNKMNKNIDIIQLLLKTEGYSGADIEYVIKEGIENTFIKNKKKLSTNDILDVINETKSITDTLKGKITEINNKIAEYKIKPASKKTN